jgi:hypothetical protein
MSGTEYLTLVLLREEDGNTNHVMFHKSLPRHDFRLPGGRPTTLPYGPTAGMCPHGSVDELKFPSFFSVITTSISRFSVDLHSLTRSLAVHYTTMNDTL